MGYGSKLEQHSSKRNDCMLRLLLPFSGSPLALLLGPVLVSALVFVVPAQAADTPVDTDPLNREPQVREAFDHFYNLDYDGALSRFEKVAAAHPDNPVATNYVLDCVLFRELYRLDLLDTTFYANDGFLTGKHTVAEDLKVREQVNQLSEKAVDQAEMRLKANPKDVNALFARGWARSLRATYMAMVQRSFGSGLHVALQARSDHEHVLQMDPNFVDAKMVVGVYQYVVGSLPLAFKILVGFTGITGSKEKGMAMLRDAADRGVITSVESRTCMMLFLRREAKYQEAIGIAQALSVQYPHDFLYVLEQGNLLKDAGNGPQAIAIYRKLLDNAKRPGYFSNPHLELAWYGLGETLRGQNRYAEAVDAYDRAAESPTTSPELKRRCLLAAGQNYDLLHERSKAVEQYQEAINAGPGTVQADAARKYMHSAYVGH
jgi:tetratricopeptide (TPR) repeat protein